MSKPPAALQVEGQRYKRVSVLLGADGQLHGIYRPAQYRHLPTADWIGKPSEQDIQFFLWCMFETIAKRPQGKGKHQSEQITGPFVTYGKSKGQRASDLSSRIYAAVRLQELLGVTNWESCRRVAAHASVESHLRTTKRGRPRQAQCPADFLDSVQIVRGLYNSYKRRHRWPEKLPQTDGELEFWWRYFLELRKWAIGLQLRAHDEARRKHFSYSKYVLTLEENPVGWSQRQVLVLKQADRIYGDALWCHFSIVPPLQPPRSTRVRNRRPARRLTKPQ